VTFLAELKGGITVTGEWLQEVEIRDGMRVTWLVEEVEIADDVRVT